MVRFRDDPGPVILVLSPTRYFKDLGVDRGSLCLQVRRGSSLMRGIVRNEDESRRAEVFGSGTQPRPRN